MSEIKLIRKGAGRKFALVDGTAVELDQIDEPRMVVEIMAESDLLESLYYTLAPGAHSGEAAEHRGQEVHVVLQGEVEFVSGDHRVTAHKGDVVWHRSEEPHTVRNPGEVPAVVFLVNLPASFNW